MYCTISDLKGFLGISTTTDDALLYELVLRAQKSIEKRTGRVFEVPADTTRYLDAAADVVGRLLLLRAEYARLTSITNGDGVAVAASDYVTEPRNGTPFYAVTLKGSAGLVWTYTDDPENAITVVGRAGYSIVPPDDIVIACLRWAAHMYRAKDAQVMESMLTEQGIVAVQSGIPKDVYELIRGYVRLT
jgi:hypothetical protein